MPEDFPANRHDRQSQLTMKILRRVFQAEPSEESSSGGTGVSPVNDGQSRETRDVPPTPGRARRTGIPRQEPGNEKEEGLQTKMAGNQPCLPGFRPRTERLSGPINGGEERPFSLF
jgi:hypothetical protein